MACTIPRSARFHRPFFMKILSCSARTTKRCAVSSTHRARRRRTPIRNFYYAVELNPAPILHAQELRENSWDLHRFPVPRQHVAPMHLQRASRTSVIPVR
jgi:hypothetical protein